MVEWMKEAGLPEPEYKEKMGGFEGGKFSLKNKVFLANQ